MTADPAIARAWMPVRTRCTRVISTRGFRLFLLSKAAIALPSRRCPGRPKCCRRRRSRFRQRCSRSTPPKGPQRFFRHTRAGPVAVRGAKAGQVLQVDIEKIEPHSDRVTTSCGRSAGALPDDFPEARLVHIALDRKRKGLATAMGTGRTVPAVFRRDGSCSAVGPGRVADAAAAEKWRQHRQQGARRRHDAIPSRLHRRRVVFHRRRAWRAGRRRGLHHRGGNRRLWTFRLTVRDDFLPRMAARLKPRRT